MAEDTDKKTSDKIADELSVGNFAKVQVRTFAFTVGGLAAGIGLGWLASKLGLGNKVGSWLAKNDMVKAMTLGREPTAKEAALAGNMAVTGVGALTGVLTGTAASQYEHWSKVERERLGVEEINKDVASTMARRGQFEETLDRQNSAIQKLLDEGPNKDGHAQNVAEQRENATEAALSK